jgi:hypothetical protein
MASSQTLNCPSSCLLLDECIQVGMGVPASSVKHHWLLVAATVLAVMVKGYVLVDENILVCTLEPFANDITSDLPYGQQ